MAYAIYTSGTTGAPKGVLIGNAAFSAAVVATVAALGLDQTTRTLCVSPFHFDGSFGTLFPTLFAGGAVVIRPREALLFPRTFFNAVANEDITYTGFSPSYLRVLLSSPQVGKLAGTTLDVVALGGEACSAADVEALWAAAPGVRVFNRYGPTETTIAVTHVELTPGMVADGVVSMGRPHPGVDFHLVDESGHLVDGAGQVGELHIGGAQLMTGYWGAPGLTAEVLRTDVVEGRTLYRTGDLVYRTPEGDYVYVDRADRVIKRMGVRISLVELAEALRGLDGVTAATCVAYDDAGSAGHRRLRGGGGTRFRPRHPPGRRRTAARVDVARPHRAGGQPPPHPFVQGRRTPVVGRGRIDRAAQRRRLTSTGPPVPSPEGRRPDGSPARPVGYTVGIVCPVSHRRALGGVGGADQLPRPARVATLTALAIVALAGPRPRP